jgi:hypothetical protein
LAGFGGGAAHPVTAKQAAPINVAIQKRFAK